jgi:hypothetical protein
MIAFVRKTIATLIRNPTWGLAIAVVIALFVNISTILYIASLQNDLQVIFNTDHIGQNYIQSARIKLLTIDRDINNLFLLIDTDKKDLAAERILTNKRDVEALLAKSKQFYRARKSIQLVGEAGKLFAECAITIDSLIGLSKSGATGEALGIITGYMKTKFETLDDRLSYLDGLKQKHDLKVFKNIDYQLSISIIFTVIALVITIGVKIFMYRKKRKPVGKEPVKVSP